jgi:hypothetical protein
VKAAFNVTALFGILKVHGLLDDPPEQDTPALIQPENCQTLLGVGVAVTVIGAPTTSEQPELAQLGLTVPEPEAEATPVYNF